MADTASCTVLFIAAIAAFSIRKYTIVPDILGSISILTRDNTGYGLAGCRLAFDGLATQPVLVHVKVNITEFSGHEHVEEVCATYAGAIAEEGWDLEPEKRYM